MAEIVQTPDREVILGALRQALESISAPRYFETERGFQGALLVELARHFPKGFLPPNAIIEQEYQKRLSQHGLSIRPDIILHEPYDPKRHKDRSDGNIAVVEMKLNGGEKEAAADFKNLLMMIEVLCYPIAVFINIASSVTHAHLVPVEARGRIVVFAVSLNNGITTVIQSDT